MEWGKGYEKAKVLPNRPLWNIINVHKLFSRLLKEIPDPFSPIEQGSVFSLSELPLPLVEN